MTVLNIERIYKTSSNIAQITATVSSEKETFADLDAVLAKRFGGRIKLIENTVRNTTGRSYTPMVTAYVSLQSNSMDVNEDTMKNFKVVQANIFSDSENNIWKAIDLGDGVKRIVQTSNDDIEAILYERRGRLTSITTASFEPEVDFNTNQYVWYVDVASAEVRGGIGIVSGGKYQVIDRIKRAPVQVTASNFVAASDFDSDDSKIQLFEMDVFEENANLSPVRAAQAIEYYKLLYGSQPIFFKQLEDLINQLTIQ